MTENWYVVLELEFDPIPVEDETIIKQRIQEKIKFWSGKANDFNKGAEYRRYLDYAKKGVIEKEMIGRGNIRAELIEDAHKTVYGPIDKMLKQMHKTEIPADSIEKMAKMFGVTEDIIKKRIAALGMTVVDYEATYEKYYKAKPAGIDTYKGISSLLESFHVRDLYEFLYKGTSVGNPASQSCDALRARASEKKKKEFYKNDGISGTGSKLCGQCEQTFKDDASKAEYDRCLEYMRTTEILDNVRSIYDLTGELSSESAVDFAGKLESVFADKALANNVFTAFCIIEKIPIPDKKEASSPSNNTQRCRCGRVNDISDGRTTCSACGLELRVKCPDCGRINDNTVNYCICGFRMDSIYNVPNPPAQSASIKNPLINIWKGVIGLPRKTQIVLGSSISALLILFFITGIILNVVIPERRYAYANNLLQEEHYAEAYSAFAELGDYKGSDALAKKARQLESDSEHYNKALALLSENRAEEAVAEFKQTNGYRDSNAQADSLMEAINLERYNQAEQLFNIGNYEESIKIYNTIAEYKDSKDKIESAEESINKEKYNEAEVLLAKEQYDEAIKAFSLIKNYSDSQDRISQIEELKLEKKYIEAEAYESSGDYKKAVDAFKDLDSYKDSSDRYLKAMYEYAVSNKSADNVLTQKYLMDLKKIGYEDSQQIYDSLFYYTIDMIVNNSEDDISTNLTECDSKTDIYLHFNLRYTGDESLVSDANHTINYEVWGYGRENSNTIKDVKPGWGWICKSMGGGRGATDLIFKLTLDNNPQIFERKVTVYWVDAYTGEHRYD